MPSPVKAISSANGLAAVARAYELLTTGAPPLTAAVEGVTVVEDDPTELTVGYGGLPNEDGIVELDAGVMDGPTHSSGSVAGLQRVRHAARLAKLVLEQTDHSLLVGEGALRFARAQGFPEENLLTETARRIWLYWKQSHSEKDDWLPPPVEQLDPEVRRFFRLDVAPALPPTGYRRSEANDRPTGTIHCACINAAGEISCATTTSGLAFKIPGRVGDSAVIGAGLYVDQRFGSCGSTGRGEANLRICASFAAVELMRRGASPVEAGLEVLRRVVESTTEPRLRGPDGRPNFGVKYYLLNAQGEHAGVSLWGPSEFAICDEQGARLEQCVSLYDEGQRDKGA